MDVKPGYKQTEVGVIPEDWECMESGALATYFGGNAFKSEAAVSNGIRWLKIANVGKQRAQWNEVSYLPNSYAADFKDYILREGDVVMALTRPILNNELKIAKLIERDVPSLLNQRVAKVISRPGTDLDFIYHVLQTRHFVDSMNEAMAGTDPPNIGSRTLGRIPIAAPLSVEEQRAIAAALRDVDALIAALDRLIAKMRDIKQAAMQELLTGKRRLPGFSGNWEVKHVGEFTDCTAGGTPSTRVSDYWSGDIRWMNSGELNLKMVTEVEGRITNEGLRNSSTKIIPANCVLIGLAGQGKTRGTVAMNLVPLCTNQSIAAIFPNPTFVSEYLYYNLDARYDELRELSAGDGGRGGLNLTIIRSLAVPFPSVAEQTAIAAIHSDMDAEIAALEIRREKTRALKQGMMQELLTGRIRLV